MNSCSTFNGFDREPTHHSHLHDQDFIRKFENGSLEPRLFTHEAHLRLAWLYLKNNTEEKAIKKTCLGIRNFDILHGAGDKYHVTVTVASVKIVKNFMQKSNANNFNELMMEHPILLSSFKALLDQHYGFNIFSNATAKMEYVSPDRLPFD